MKEINLLFSINEKYIDKLGCVLHSIMKHDPGNNYVAYVMHSNIPDAAWGRLSGVREYYFNLDIVPVQVDKSLFENLPIRQKQGKHITMETYFRFALDLLPDRVEKILYMDVDILVRKSIEPLWDHNPEVIAGVIDTYGDTLLNTPSFVPHRWWRKKINPFPVRLHKQNLGLKDGQSYINAGILLINCRNIPQGVLFDLLRETSRLRRKRHLKMQDQDVINSYFKDSIELIDREYNFQTGMMFGVRGEINPDVTIAHFTGDIKPWQSFESVQRPWSFVEFTQEYAQEFEEFQGLSVGESS